MKQFILSILILTSTSLYAQCQGDTNEDGTVNVADIVETVNIIFDGNTDCEEETDNLYDVTINFDMDSTPNNISQLTIHIAQNNLDNIIYEFEPQSYYFYTLENLLSPSDDYYVYMTSNNDIYNGYVSFSVN